MQAEGFQGAWGHCGQIWEVGSTLGIGRHCGRLGDLQLAEGLREGRLTADHRLVIEKLPYPGVLY